MRLEWLTSWSEIQDPAFMEQWAKWATIGNTYPFYDPDISTAYIQAYQTKKRLKPRFLVIYDANLPLLMWPMVISTSSWKDGYVRFFEPLGADRFDYHDPVLMGGDVFMSNIHLWKSFFDEIAKFDGYDCINIPRIHTSLTCNSFVPTELAPYIPLDRYANYKDLMRNIHKGLRQDLGRQIRRLQSMGDLKLEVYGPDTGHDVVNRVFCQWIAAKDAQWPGTIKHEVYYRALVDNGLSSGTVHLSSLSMAGVNISWHIGFVKGKRYFYYSPAYSFNFKNYSPGKVHLAYLVDCALDAGCTHFDLMRGNERYKSMWTNFAEKLFGHNAEMKRFGNRIRNGIGKVLKKLRGC